VADIAYGPAAAAGAAQLDDRPAVVMMSIGQYSANTLTVPNRLGEVLADFGHT
jgi:Cu/Ag efflux pump CusA